MIFLFTIGDQHIWTFWRWFSFVFERFLFGLFKVVKDMECWEHCYAWLGIPPCFGYVFFFARSWIQVLSWMNLDEIQYECARLSRLFIWINMWCCTSPSVLRCYDYVFFYVEHDCFKFKFLIWLPKMFATICICVIQIFKWQIRLLLTHFDFYSVSHLESPPLPKKANINCHLSLTVLPTTCIYMSTSLVLPTDTCQLTAFCCHSLPVCV